MTAQQKLFFDKAKRIIGIFALAILMFGGLYMGAYLYTLPPTYEAEGLDLQKLYNDPDSYDVSKASGVAGIIISEDLAKTSSVNAVTAVVFDFRGYDTLGESFVLLTAISGSMVILRKSRKGLGHAYEKKH